MEKKLVSPQVIVAVILLAVALVGLFFFFPTNNQPNDNKNDGQCTLEAKLCPDGTAVGREGPNCEFPECPDSIDTKND